MDNFHFSISVASVRSRDAIATSRQLLHKTSKMVGPKIALAEVRHELNLPQSAHLNLGPDAWPCEGFAEKLTDSSIVWINGADVSRLDVAEQFLGKFDILMKVMGANALDMLQLANAEIGVIGDLRNEDPARADDLVEKFKEIAERQRRQIH